VIAPWLIYLAVFVLTTVAAYQGQASLATYFGQRRRTADRMRTLAGEEAGTPAIELRRSLRGGSDPVSRWLTRLIVQSGTARSPVALFGMAVGIGILLFLVLPGAANWSLRLLLALSLGSLAVMAWLRVMRRRRIARFGDSLPEILDIITRSLRAGHPLPVSLALVAREIGAPAGPEFALLVDEISYGRSVPEALERIYHRVGYPELRFVVAAVSIGQQTGGNLGEILARLSRTLRERQRLVRKVRALSAEGRFSGLALSILPVALFALINLVSPSYYAEFWASPLSGKILALSLALMVAGNVVILRLVNLKV
jgi:tight adherence protein B